MTPRSPCKKESLCYAFAHLLLASVQVWILHLLKCRIEKQMMGKRRLFHVSINSISRPHQDWISQLMLTLSNDALAIHEWRA